MRVITAAELTLDDIDLQDVATTSSPLIIDATGMFQFNVVMTKTLAAGTATTGLGSMGMIVYRDREGTDVIFVQSIGNTIDLKIDSGALGGTREIVTFGGSGAEYSGSGGLGSGLGAVRVIPFFSLFFNVSEAVDVVASAVGDMVCLMEGFNR